MKENGKKSPLKTSVSPKAIPNGKIFPKLSPYRELQNQT